jgi:ribosome-binding factor A
MPKFRRTDRINEQFKQEISLIVRDEVRDPRVGLATITAVQTSPELDHAKVYITTLGDEEEREEILVGLRSAAPFIRKQLAGRLSMRRIPELHFEADRVLAEAMRIERLLREALPHGIDTPAPGDDSSLEASSEAGVDGDEGEDGQASGAESRTEGGAKE